MAQLKNPLRVVGIVLPGNSGSGGHFCIALWVITDQALEQTADHLALDHARDQMKIERFRVAAIANEQDFFPICFLDLRLLLARCEKEREYRNQVQRDSCHVQGKSCFDRSAMQAD